MIWYIIIATLVVSLISLVGLIAGGNKVKKFLHYFIAFAAGTLIAASFFDLIPHAIESLEIFGMHLHESIVFVVLGIVLFFLIETFIHWHHCGHEGCSKKPAGILIFTGDFVHNFVDGILIAGAFMLNTATGIVTTLIVLVHEIPQEFGDFAVLLNSGYSKFKALKINFVSALSAVLGGILGFFMFDAFEKITPYVVLIAAGGFLYIALSDIIPEMHGNHKHKSRRIVEAIIFVLSIVVMKFLFGLLH